MRQDRKLTKRQRRILRQEGVLDTNNQMTNKFSLIDIDAHYKLNEMQDDVMDAYFDGNNLCLHGLAGTGKTWLSMYLALNDVMDNDQYDKLYIVRSIVPTREVGFLPGSLKDKIKIYEDPYKTICNELFGRGDAYDILKTKNYVEFLSTSYLRGVTLNNCVVIVDEINNMTFHELDSIITRMGNNTRIIFCGDYRQSDLSYDKDKEGLQKFLKVINSINSFSYFEFGVEHIVRSKLVRDYIIAKSKMGYV